MTTVREIINTLNACNNPDVPFFIQVGFNRFEVTAFVENPDGYASFLVSEDANNPPVAIPDQPEPKRIA